MSAPLWLVFVSFYRQKFSASPIYPNRYQSLSNNLFNHLFSGHHSRPIYRCAHSVSGLRNTGGFSYLVCERIEVYCKNNTSPPLFAPNQFSHEIGNIYKMLRKPGKYIWLDSCGLEWTKITEWTPSSQLNVTHFCSWGFWSTQQGTEHPQLHPRSSPAVAPL